MIKKILNLHESLNHVAFSAKRPSYQLKPKLMNFFRKSIFLGLALLSGISTVYCQDFYNQLFENYDQYKEESLKTRRFTHGQIVPLFTNLEHNDLFEVTRVGTSIEGRSLNLISFGKGDIDVLLWSQMHGDESTATMAIFDIINFFKQDDFMKQKSTMLSRLRIHFLPMLNPDGAQRFTRRNALDVDINRDAVRLQSPESKTLKKVRDSLEADFGFNLHDQSTYYNANRTPKSAAISFLAPAYNYDKDVNKVRENSMKLIVYMNAILQEFVPGHIGRYNDDFEPRAFGDNIQKWGTSTVLIESGGYPEDPDKQFLRKLNFVSIISAMEAIATKDYLKSNTKDYFKIPKNDRKLFDLKLSKVSYELLGNTYTLDIGINTPQIATKNNKGYYRKGRIDDMGDLSTHYGYQSLDASSYTIESAKIYPESFTTIDEVLKSDLKSILNQGYGYVVVEQIPEDQKSIALPVHILAKNEVPDFSLHLGANPCFFLKKDGRLRYLITNGFLVDLEQPKANFTNALIYN
ncbi:M14 metallopeptidase family protein [Galbibacter sp.]|uniref:M14 family metallopeptidase n=1 Tax=Galbibacter sp. TaxID=2918471 RepID=UPI003A95A9C0